MKPTLLMTVAIALVFLVASRLPQADAEDPKMLMQAKLEHSKALLEALATEDFSRLQNHSNELTLLSLEADWNVIQTGEYRRLSEDFRRSTRSLTEVAKAKNLDGATLAYVNVTMKCIECHKYVRSVKVGRTP